MTKSELLKYLQRYHRPMECDSMVAYLNKLSRGKKVAFTTDVILNSDSSSLLDTDSNTYHIIGVRNRGYTYIRNDENGLLKCALTAVKAQNEHTVFFAKTPEEFCNVMINRIILR